MENNTPLPLLDLIPTWQFGEKNHYLATLVLLGEKTATSSGHLFYALENTALPQIGDVSIILDNAGQPVVKIMNTAVALYRFDEVPENISLAEGEGCISEWQQVHRDFFNKALRHYSILPHSHSLLGVADHQITGDFEVICEQFTVIERFPQSYAQWLSFATTALQEENGQKDPFLNAKTDANLLLQFVTKRSKSAIFAFSETLLSDVELIQLSQLLVRRLQGEPMAYILGEKEFWSLPLKVAPSTLIPRPDTERLVEVALEWAYKRLNSQHILRVLDLGTGTGAISLALATELAERAIIIGVDNQPEIVALANYNRQNLALNNVRFLESHWFDALTNQRFDLIVSNPPYIDQEDENLQYGDVRFEPRSALVADHAGLADLAYIIEKAPDYLTAKGALFLEHGWQQASAVTDLFSSSYWHSSQTVQDYAGKDRITWAELKSEENSINGIEKRES